MPGFLKVEDEPTATVCTFSCHHIIFLLWLWEGSYWGRARVLHLYCLYTMIEKYKTTPT